MNKVYRKFLFSIILICLSMLSLSQTIPSASKLEQKISGKENIEYLYNLDDLARLKLRLGDLDSALILFKECSEGYKKTIGSKSERYGWTMNNIGATLSYQGKMQEALEYFKVCLDIYKEVYDQCNPQYFITLNNILKTYKKAQSYAEIEYLIRNYWDSQKIDSCQFSTEFLNFIDEMGYLLIKLGRNEDAANNFVLTEKIREDKFGINSVEYSTSLYNIAFGCISENSYQEAISLLEHSIQISKDSLGEINPLTLKYKEGLAEAYRGNKNFEGAIKLYSELMKVPDYYSKNSIYIDNNLASLYQDMGDYDKAIKSYKWAIADLKASENIDNELLLVSLSNLALLSMEIDSVNLAISLFSEINEKIIELLSKNLPLLSEKEKIIFMERVNYRMNVFNSFVVKEFEKHPALIDELYNNQLFVKSKILDLILCGKLFTVENKHEGLFALWKQYVNDREKLMYYYQTGYSNESETKKLENIINTLEKELNKSSIIFTETQKKLKWIDIHKQLSDTEAVVEMVSFNYYHKDWTDSIYYAALILTQETKDHPKLVFLKNGNNLDSTSFMHYQQYLTNPKQREDKDWESYQNYWAAIDYAIGDKKIVYVSPDGVYNKINIETLITPDGKYLSDKKEIRIINSSRELLQPKDSVKIKLQNALLVGNPNFNNTATDTIDALAYQINSNDISLYTTRSLEKADISPLPATEKEITTISNLLKHYKYTTTTLIGNDAQESEIKKAKSPSIIHIATHGYFDQDLKNPFNEKSIGTNADRVTENPMLRSGLLLAGSAQTIKGKFNPKKGTENGILTAYEVQNMNLENTELVVLSACETGLGEIQNGEGVYGLQRAFRIAGAKTIIMSLWKVDDEATQLLMTTFYEKWLSGKTKREAFKDAQNVLKNSLRYNHPYYWGAFVMIGA